MKRAILSALVLAALASSPAQANTRLPGIACPKPVMTPWRMMPDGCIFIRRDQKSDAWATLPRGTTEVDIWSSNLRTHLVQERSSYPGDKSCPQWGFSAPGYEAGWVTCNRDVFSYRRAIVVYYWRG